MHKKYTDLEKPLQKQRRPKLFWVSAIAPIVTVIVGGLFAYFGHADKHGIPIVSFPFLVILKDLIEVKHRVIVLQRKKKHSNC